MPYFKSQEGYNLYYENINPDSDSSIILLHGFASSASFFKSQIKMLKENYRIIVGILMLY